MWIEDFDNFDNVDSSSWVSQAPEKASESAEKARDKAKKSAASFAKSQKDEKKAQKYDLLLAWFLVKIIVNKRYDFILTELFQTTDYWYPSNFVLWVLSLINIEISNKIRAFSGKQAILFKYKSEQAIEFNDNNLPKEIKDRINYWIEDIIDSTTINYSELQIKRISRFLMNDEKVIVEYINKILVFFLKEANILIKKSEAFWISNFIINEVLKSIQSVLAKHKDEVI